MELGLHTLKFFPAEASGGLAMLKALTLPDLAEPHEFRNVSLYHAQREPVPFSHCAQPL